MLTVITGVGAKGQVGAAVAAFLGARGDELVIVSRDEEQVNARSAELRAAGYKVSAYPCDLADAASVDVFARTLTGRHGNRIDALVNLAGGFALAGPLAESDPAAFERMLRINLTTAYLTTRALLPALGHARGSIVFFASEAVLEGVSSRGISAYAAAKAGVVALMRSVADECRGQGIRANALAPAAIRTASNEAAMGMKTSYVEPAAVASAVAFLCSPASAAITGQVVRLRPMPASGPGPSP